MDIPMKATNLMNIITHFFTTLFTWKNIFTQLTFTLLLPLSFIFSAHTFFPNFLKNPHHIFTFTFTFTYTDSVFDLIMFTFLFTFHRFLTIGFTAYSNDNINIYINTLFDIKPTKLALHLVSRLILTFMFVYSLTLFSYNLMVAIVDLTDTIVFTVFVIWDAIFHMYFVGLLLLFTFVHLDMMNKQMGIRKGLAEVVPKVMGGYLVNVLVMSPLIRNVAKEFVAPMWDVMIRGMIGVVFLPTFVFQIVHFIRFTTRLELAAN